MYVLGTNTCMYVLWCIMYVCMVTNTCMYMYVLCMYALGTNTCIRCTGNWYMYIYVCTYVVGTNTFICMYICMYWELIDIWSAGKYFTEGSNLSTRPVVRTWPVPPPYLAWPGKRLLCFWQRLVRYILWYEMQYMYVCMCWFILVNQHIKVL